jgi:hypothetical protein
MSTFNTSDATAGIYDITGIFSSEKPGDGSQLCICGSFGTASAKAGDPRSNGLLCVWVDEKGFEEIWWSGSTDNRVASSFQMSAQGKSLPRCDKVDLVSMSQASVATRSVQAASSVATPATATSTADSKGVGSTTTSLNSPHPTSQWKLFFKHGDSSNVLTTASNR